MRLRKKNFVADNCCVAGSAAAFEALELDLEDAALCHQRRRTMEFADDTKKKKKRKRKKMG
jgi:hypothetical protein